MTQEHTPETYDHSAAQQLAQGRATLIDEYLTPAEGQSVGVHEVGAGFEQAHAALLDTFFRQRLKEVGLDNDAGKRISEPFAIVAVGGYARKELCLHSDVDLLVICRNNIPPEALDLAQPLFLALWDQGYDLGHGFRTIKDCLDLGGSDYQVFASLLDLRFIAGDETVCQELRKRLEQKLFVRKRKGFLRWLEEQHEARRQRFGDADAMLEPQLKDGLGGLRDYHGMLWLARFLERQTGYLPGDVEQLHPFFPEANSFATFKQDLGLLFATRNQLHRLTGRKNETLYIDLQPGVAEALGFGGEGQLGKALGVETFLGRLHRSMSAIKAANRGIWHWEALPLLRKGAEPEPVSVAPGVLLREQGLEWEREDIADATPQELLKLFKQCAIHDASLSWTSRRKVQTSVATISAATSTLEKDISGPAWELFVEILCSGNASRALEQMMETDFLDVFLPQFGKVRDFVQFDSFHTYPVGWHTIKTVQCLEQLEKKGGKKGGGLRLGHLAALYSSLKDKRPLLLAALFHDLGKSGGDHESAGAAMVQDVLRARGMESNVVDTVAFLVRKHLLLSLTATRSDLGDEAIVMRCANDVGSPERLKMLYLLSCADALATGPKAWNDWTSRLLAELYDKVLHMLQEGQLVGPRSVRVILKTRDDVRRVAKELDDPTLPPEKVEYWLEQLPPHYTMRVQAEAVVSHIQLVHKLEKQLADEVKRLGEKRAGRGLVVLEARPLEAESVWTLTLAARNQPGLFASIAGVLSLHGLNIFSSDVFVWSDGSVIALFNVTPPPDPLYAEEIWAKIKGALKFAMTGKLSLDYRLDRKRSSMLADGHNGPGAVTVNVDNESTDFHTVVEVLAWDRPGLLYEIAHTLQHLQIDVQMAKVATHKDQVADYFYVRDADGQKLEDQGQIHEMRQALLHKLTRMP